METSSARLHEAFTHIKLSLFITVISALKSYNSEREFVQGSSRLTPTLPGMAKGRSRTIHGKAGVKMPEGNTDCAPAVGKLSSRMRGRIEGRAK